MNSLLKRLERLTDKMNAFANGKIVLDDLQLEKLEQEIEKVEHELLRPVHTNTDEVEDDTSDL